MFIIICIYEVVELGNSVATAYDCATFVRNVFTLLQIRTRRKNRVFNMMQLYFTSVKFHGTHEIFTRLLKQKQEMVVPNFYHEFTVIMLSLVSK